MRVALIQCACGDLPGESHESRLRRLLGIAARRGAQLAVFPELTNTSYFPALPDADGRAFAQSLTGKFASLAASLAREFGLGVVVSFAEQPARGKPFLTAICLDARGRRAGCYRKVHLPQFPAAREKDLFRAGREFPVMRLAGLNIGLLLCYDRHFPEAARTLALAGAEAIIIPSATPVAAVGSWLFELEALAFTNGAYVLAANRCGREGDLRFLGESCAISPAGEVLARAGGSEEVILVDLERAAVADSVARRAYISDRVPVAYRARRERKRK